MAKSKELLKNMTNNAEILSGIINLMNKNPQISEKIDLPIQGQDNAHYGDLIFSNQQYRNAFFNAVNQIALTVVTRAFFQNSWSFVFRGNIKYGSYVREMFVDISQVNDYNDMLAKIESGEWSCAHFACNVVPNIANYIHELNYQKYYKASTNDELQAMAFTPGDSYFDVIDQIVNGNWRGMEYDTFLVAKYILVRALVNGWIATREIPNFATSTTREKAAYIQNITTKFTFMSPNFNAAGVRMASSMDDMIIILNTEFSADINVDVLSTSYFKNYAEFKVDMALIDSFYEWDEERLKELLGKNYIPFTDSELEALKGVPAIVMDRRWFQFYRYSLDNRADPNAYSGTRQGSFFNMETLFNNHWLHDWGIRSFSPFYQACAFVTGSIGVISVTVSPDTVSASVGQQVAFFANVVTKNFANKSVLWSYTTSGTGNGEIHQNGVLKILDGSVGDTFTVTATSIYDNTKVGTATVTIV